MPPFAIPLLCLLVAADAPAEKAFQVNVLDDATGRGVPLVELTTVNHLRYFTDSNGVVAINEPGLMGQSVYFHVKSHGYEYPKDGFGFRGKALEVKPGGRAELKIKRLNVAERLYRVTGGGIYADSTLLGLPTPLKQPNLNGQVLGSDSVVNAVYHGKLHWFWGDTNKPGYPLGNFHVPGATSSLPADGGLDPDKGVDLTYWLDARGFAKATARMPGDGPTWIGGLTVLRDPKGRERLFAGYVKIRNALDVYERGLAEFDDDKQEFRQVTKLDLAAPLWPHGHTFLRKEGDAEYVYFCNPFPLVRVKADPEAFAKLTEYEAYTCLKLGSRLDGHEVERENGKPRYAWKKNTPAIGPAEQARLIKAGVLKAGEVLLPLTDFEGGKSVQAHGGTVCWNAYRKRWVLLAVEIGGTSLLGEMWYAEADTPLGPWAYARKVVTHDKYSFYNPRQHPYFDQDGGRVIFFEGTYTATFSGNTDLTPRYDYNQVMYKLDLADPRLNLPVPIYALTDEGTADSLGRPAKADQARPVAFLALDRAGQGTVPVSVVEENGQRRLQAGPKGEATFHALPADGKTVPRGMVPLFEHVHAKDRKRIYTTDQGWTKPGYERTGQPVCLVWPALGNRSQGGQRGKE